MARMAGIAGRIGANAVRVVQRGVGHFALPRGGMWVRLRLAPPIEDLLPPSLLRARDHSLSSGLRPSVEVTPQRLPLPRFRPLDSHRSVHR